MNVSTIKSILSLFVSLWLLIPAVYAQRPIQISLIPGWGSNGPLNARETNNFSINLIGGSAAGLDGVELGGVFNSERKTVKGFQAAGIFNWVGDSVKGIQTAGVFNFAQRFKGVQVAGLVNKTHYLKGVQLGVINIADTSDGVSIGLLAIVRHGMHELSVYADEWSPFNIAFRSGTRKLYGILIAGMNPDRHRRSYYFGYGLGHQIDIAQQLSLRPELSFIHLAPLEPHNFDHNDFLTRFNLDLHWQPSKEFGLSAGPSLTMYDPQRDYYTGSVKYEPLPHGYSTFSFKHSAISGWIGWRVAVSLL